MRQHLRAPVPTVAHDVDRAGENEAEEAGPFALVEEVFACVEHGCARAEAAPRGLEVKRIEDVESLRHCWNYNILSPPRQVY